MIYKLDFVSLSQLLVKPFPVFEKIENQHIDFGVEFLIKRGVLSTPPILCIPHWWRTDVSLKSTGPQPVNYYRLKIATVHNF